MRHSTFENSWRQSSGTKCTWTLTSTLKKTLESTFLFFLLHRNRCSRRKTNVICIERYDWNWSKVEAIELELFQKYAALKIRYNLIFDVNVLKLISKNWYNNWDVAFHRIRDSLFLQSTHLMRITTWIFIFKNFDASEQRHVIVRNNYCLSLLFRLPFLLAWFVEQTEWRSIGIMDNFLKSWRQISGMDVTFWRQNVLRNFHFRIR